LKINHLGFLGLFIVLNISVLQAQSKNSTPKSTLFIPPKQVVTIDYPYMKGYQVKIWNKSKLELGISFRDHQTDTLTKGFGLKKGSFETIQIQEKNYLQLENRFIAPLKVEYSIFKAKPGKKKINPTRRAGFYLLNSTAQSLPIIIPGVMNPNLSPFSRSGVDLPWGQKIYLKTPGKNLLILTVSDSIRKGSQIDVADLIDAALNKE